MNRRPDWPRRLNAYVNSVQRRPFRFGKFDCCIFAAGAVKAMTGTDPMREFRGTYKSEREAMQALRDHGSGSLYHTLRSKFGNPVPGAHGRRGDVAYHEGACGIVLGRFALFIGQEGLAMVPISQLDRAFRVPE